MNGVRPSLTLLLLLCAVASPVVAQTLRYLGQQILPHGYAYGGTTVGGLSGLDHDANTNRFVAVSDDRSERQPARFYTLELDLAAFNTDEEPGFAGVRITGVTILRTGDGDPHEAGTVDPESIRHAGDGGYWWASEGNVMRGIPPAIEKVSAGGTALRRLALPAHVLAGPDRGVRHNLAFESLTLSDGRLFAGTENALVQDGPQADLDQPSPSRLLVFDEVSGRRLAEYVYLVDAVPVPPAVPGLYRTNGLVELLAGEGALLALERSYTMGLGNSVRIFRVDLTGADDVAGRPSLAGNAYIPVGKTLLLDLGVLGIPVGNLEGMSWGPKLPSGDRSLVLVADDNFSARQYTRFLAFALRDQPQRISAAPPATMIAPATRQRPMRSLSSRAPKRAAKITEVSRKPATAGIGATVIAQSTSP